MAFLSGALPHDRSPFASYPSASLAAARAESGRSATLRQMEAEVADLAKARGSAASILARFIEHQMAFKEPHYRFVRLFLAQLAGKATHADTWGGEVSAALDPTLVRLFEKLQKRGLVRTDVDVPTLVATFKIMQLGLMVLWAIEGPPWAGIGEVVRRQARLFCSGIEVKR